jgi:hypothetical protein
VTPPQLTGDTPVLNIAHPGEVHVFVLLRHELDVAVFNRFNRRFASTSARTYHWSVSIGSITTPRSPYGTVRS